MFLNYRVLQDFGIQCGSCRWRSYTKSDVYSQFREASSCRIYSTPHASVPARKSWLLGYAKISAAWHLATHRKSIHVYQEILFSITTGVCWRKKRSGWLIRIPLLSPTLRKFDMRAKSDSSNSMSASVACQLPPTPFIMRSPFLCGLRFGRFRIEIRERFPHFA